jgi:hypothetical protein
MSDKLGPLSFGKRDEMVFLGRSMGEQRDYSDEVARTIDEEVRAIIDKAYERATEVLRPIATAVALAGVVAEETGCGGFEPCSATFRRRTLHSIRRSSVRSACSDVTRNRLSRRVRRPHDGSRWGLALPRRVTRCRLEAYIPAYQYLALPEHADDCRRRRAGWSGLTSAGLEHAGRSRPAVCRLQFGSTPRRTDRPDLRAL